mgnify:CR=1 FL=1
MRRQGAPRPCSHHHATDVNTHPLGPTIARSPDPLSPEPDPSLPCPISQVRWHIVEHGDRLDMNYWHGFSNCWHPGTKPEHACKTAHCLAGWAQALFDDHEIRGLHAQDAGIRLIPLAVDMFFESNGKMFEWLNNCEYAK